MEVITSMGANLLIMLYTVTRHLLREVGFAIADAASSISNAITTDATIVIITVAAVKLRLLTAELDLLDEFVKFKCL